MSVNLQVAELEQHIIANTESEMTNIGWGVTKEETAVPYIYISHSRSSFPFIWGSLRLTPIMYPLANLEKLGIALGMRLLLTIGNHIIALGGQSFTQGQ